VGLILYRGASNMQLSLRHGTWTNVATTTWDVAATHFPQCDTNQGGIYLKLVFSATNTFQGYWSPDGVNWISGGVDASKTMTPSRGGLMVSAFGAANTVNGRFEYFRVNG
jgi:hypothetical protein